ncbi:MAG TPA: hypothetical protein VMW01_02695, partial [Williamwhitmania sp.]|nr:hypothetical protein [Williamwhitmania sp.]
MDNDFQGYRGKALEILKHYHARVWGQVEIESTRGKYWGVVLPRAETHDEFHLVLKFETGYNIGVDVRTITFMKEVGYSKANYQIPEKQFPYSKELPNVKLLG